MPLGFTRRADMPDDQVAVAQTVAPNLRLRDIDIIWAGLVMPRAQETDPLAHTLQDAAAHFQALALRLGLLDFQDKILLFQADGILHVQVSGHLAQCGQRRIFKFQYFHVCHIHNRCYL